MANLTAQLSEVNASARALDAPAESGGFATGLDALAKGVSTISSVLSDRSQRKRQEASAAREDAKFKAWQRDDARSEATYSASQSALARITEVENAANGHNAAVDAPIPTYNELAGPATVGSGIPTLTGEPLDPQMQALQGADDHQMSLQVADMSKRIAKAEAARSQGKLSKIAVDSMKMTIWNSILKDFPDADRAKIAGVFRENGVDDGLFRQMKYAGDQVNADQKRTIEDRTNYINVGKANWIQLEGMPAPTEDDYYSRGVSFTQADNAAKAARADWEFDRRQIDASNSDRKTAEADANETGSRAFGLQALALTHDLTQTIQQIAGAGFQPGVDPSKDARITSLLGNIYSKRTNWANQLFQQAITPLEKGGLGMSVEVATRERDNWLKNFDQQLVDPLKNRTKDFMDSAAAMRTHLNLSVQQAYPMMAELRAQGVDLDSIPGLVRNLTPETIAAVQRELKGIRPGRFFETTGRQHMQNAVLMLDGKLNAHDLDDRNAKKNLVGAGYNYSVNEAKNVLAGSGNPDKWINATLTVVASTDAINANSDPRFLNRAMGVSIRPDVQRATDSLLANSQTRDEALTLARASRASVAHLTLESKKALAKTAAGTFFVPIFEDGRFKLRFDRQRYNKSGAGPIRGYAPEASGFESRPTQPTVPPALQEMLNNVNGGLTYLVRTRSWEKDDPATPKGSEAEARAFYAMGTPTADMQKARKSRESGDQSFDRLLSDAERQVRGAPDEVPMGDIRGGFGPNSDIAGPEGTGKNPRSSAVGVGQFTDNTWVTTLSKHAPEIIRGKSRSEILALRTSNPDLARDAIGWLRRDNAVELKKAGIEPTRANTALAHFAGSGGATALIKADPNAPVERVLGPAAVNANPHLRGKTASQVIEWAKKFYRA